MGEEDIEAEMRRRGDAEIETLSPRLRVPVSPRLSFILKFRRLLRGEVSAHTAALEAMRRFGVLKTRWRERAQFAELDCQPARLREEFTRVGAADLLAHFRSRARPKFFPGFDDPAVTARLEQEIFPAETKLLLHQAQRIAGDHCWNLPGLDEKCFGKEQIGWNRDPLSGFTWPLDYHADINLMRNDGSDVRVVWELNRLAHLVTLGRAYAITSGAVARPSGRAQADIAEQFSAEFFRQLTSWRMQNPAVRGINWNCFSIRSCCVTSMGLISMKGTGKSCAR